MSEVQEDPEVSNEYCLEPKQVLKYLINFGILSYSIMILNIQIIVSKEVYEYMT